MDIDGLCDAFSSGSIQNLSKIEEFEDLSYSQDVDINTLRNSTWVKKANNRYSRYLEYTNITISEDQDLKIIHLLIMDYLSFRWGDNSEIEMMVQTAKCIAIDKLILIYITSE